MIQHVTAGLTPATPAGHNPARTAANGRKFGNIGPKVGRSRENRSGAIVAGFSGIVAGAATGFSGQPAETAGNRRNEVTVRRCSMLREHADAYDNRTLTSAVPAVNRNKMRAVVRLLDSTEGGND